ncbi:MAG: dioxygenase [Sphingomonadales bacterium]|nr:dioxygenase [Sphingomonadales bacterium]MDE2568382.1 dioxygenase [Sphingomonadales bacterium]
MSTQPSFYIPHGGGPCFFMDDPAGIWTGMERFLRELPGQLPEPPRAIIVVSGHWEAEGFHFTSAAKPRLLFDYYGFPQHTYELCYDAPGSPELAARAAELLRGAGLKAGLDPERGLDHGVFVPLLVAFPEARIPVIEMSLDRSLDPALHIAAGKALAPLRDEGVLILGSGMSFHNMRAYGDPRATEPSQAFDHWLTQAVEQPGPARGEALAHWAEAPAGRFSHPREEHLIPLMVAAGTTGNAGQIAYGEIVMRTAISGYRFD